MKRKHIPFKEYFQTYRSNDDKKWYWYFIVRLGPFLSYIFYNLGITASQVDFLGFAVSIITFVLLSLGTYETALIGSFMLIFWTVLDASDGSISRVTKDYKANGCFLATMGHYFNVYLAFLGLTIGLFNKTGNSKFLLIGLVVIVFHALINFLIRIRQVIIYRFTGKLNLPVKSGNSEKSWSIKDDAVEVFRFITNHLNDETGLVPLFVIFAFLGKLEYVLYIYLIFTVSYYFLIMVYTFLTLDLDSETPK